MFLFIFLGLSAVCSAQVAKNQVTADEVRLAERVNQYRDSLGLPRVPLSASLTIVAKTHALDLERHPPNWTSCNAHSWSKSGPWTAVCYDGSMKAAEKMWSKPAELTAYQGRGYEIVYGLLSPHSDEECEATQIDIEMALSGWKGSVHHNAVIANTGIWKQTTWQAMGIAVYKCYAIIWFGEEADPAGPPVRED